VLAGTHRGTPKAPFLPMNVSSAALSRFVDVNDNQVKMVNLGKFGNLMNNLRFHCGMREGGPVS
jgi:hypothetical protein